MKLNILKVCNKMKIKHYSMTNLLDKNIEKERKMNVNSYSSSDRSHSNTVVVRRTASELNREDDNPMKTSLSLAKGINERLSMYSGTSGTLKTTSQRSLTSQSSKDSHSNNNNNTKKTMLNNNNKKSKLWTIHLIDTPIICFPYRWKDAMIDEKCTNNRQVLVCVCVCVWYIQKQICLGYVRGNERDKKKKKKGYHRKGEDLPNRMGKSACVQHLLSYQMCCKRFMCAYFLNLKQFHTTDELLTQLMASVNLLVQQFQLQLSQPSGPHSTSSQLEKMPTNTEISESSSLTLNSIESGNSSQLQWCNLKNAKSNSDGTWQAKTKTKSKSESELLGSAKQDWTSLLNDITYSHHIQQQALSLKMSEEHAKKHSPSKSLDDGSIAPSIAIATLQSRSSDVEDAEEEEEEDSMKFKESPLIESVKGNEEGATLSNVHLYNATEKEKEKEKREEREKKRDASESQKITPKATEAVIDSPRRDIGEISQSASTAQSDANKQHKNANDVDAIDCNLSMKHHIGPLQLSLHYYFFFFFFF
ncbi:hypothetical protein RFI_14184 [Reticulomyxa filosa]|uniref:Uncharacterized protein n=1 Tax=Reticulomyxa filosa TaxID=46433 RepID=X6NCF7_RETFI|nr:hypothetical protein RFI_14184 [Reticulomyxa filosa]|eukprot:ETO23002.1 hypothetical protein RFI_14184 [Reticulomyxa filosa]